MTFFCLESGEAVCNKLVVFGKSDEFSFSAKELIQKARAIERRVVKELPGEGPLHEVAGSVTELAEQANAMPKQWKKFVSFNALRCYVVFGALIWGLCWAVNNFWSNQDIKVAVTESQTDLLEMKINQTGLDNRIRIEESKGSAASRDLLRAGLVDMAVIQAGIDLDKGMTVLGVVRHEHILFFVHESMDTFPIPGERPVVLTGALGQGSHLLGSEFFKSWGAPRPDWKFGWSDFANVEDPMPMPENVQAIFVVIDPVDDRMQPGIKRAAKLGFKMHDSSIGAFESKHPYLHRVAHHQGFFRRAQPDVPDRDINGYLVDNYLVAGKGVSEQQVLWALQAFELGADGGRLMTNYLTSGRSTMIEDAANFTTIPINVVIIIVALFGIEVLTERKYLHRLNGLISRISLLQADHDLYGWHTGESIALNAKYLDACSDLLGMISTVAAYYGERRSAMSFDSMTNMLDSRANDLKINIGLKLIQGNAMLSAQGPPADEDEESDSQADTPPKKKPTIKAKKRRR